MVASTGNKSDLKKWDPAQNRTGPQVCNYIQKQAEKSGYMPTRAESSRVVGNIRSNLQRVFKGDACVPSRKSAAS